MIRARPESKGWLRDVLTCVQMLPTGPFTLDDMYRFEPELKVLHTANQNVRPKIRQQLQVMVSRGILRRERPGVYALEGRRTGNRQTTPGV
jgi:type II restriction enzyme